MDIHHMWGSDLSLASNGDLLGAEGTEEGKQRVLRRLLTPPLDNIWDPDYGAGLPSKVGSTFGPEEIEGITRSQMFLEEIVSQDPIPEVSSDGKNGTVAVRIRYQDATTAEPVVVGFVQRE